MAKPSEKITPENYLETNLRLLIWTGLNRPLVTRRVISALFVLRSFYIFGTFVLLNLGCFAHIKIVNKNSLLASSINVLQIIIYAEGMLHVLYHGIRNKALHCLIANVRKSFRFSSNTGHFTMHEPIRILRRRSITWVSLCALAVTCWSASAVARGEDPVPVWAPVDREKSPYFEINLFLQFTGQLLMGILSGCFGAFYTSVLSLVKYQFDLLSCSLEHVARLAVLKTRRRIHGGDETTSAEFESKSFSEKETSPRCECCTEEFKRFFQTFEKRRFEKALTLWEMRIYEEELYKTLMDCIFHHQNMIELKNAVNEFFGPVILFRFLMSTMMLCFNIYSTSKVTAEKDFDPTDMTFLNLVEYYLMGAGELFVFCYVPDSLLRTSIEIPDVIFGALPWHGGSVRKNFISTLMIFHLNASKPTSLRTLFYVVSLDIMKTMFRASFSFYTVLCKIQSK